MTWSFLEIGYNFYFQKECLNGIERDRLLRTLDELSQVDDPLQYEQLLTSCPTQERLIFKILESELLLAVLIHDRKDTEFPNSLELVKIINPKSL